MPEPNRRGLRKAPRIDKVPTPRSYTWRLWLGALVGLLGGYTWYLIIRSGVHFLR